MSFTKFNIWLESRQDIFGFGRGKDDTKVEEDDGPVNTFSSHKMISMLSNHMIGQLKPSFKYVNEVHWGSGNGAIRVHLGTGLNVMIERKCIDKTGNETWITKRIYQINQSGYGGYEQVVVEDILDVLETIHESSNDSIADDYKGLERLAINIMDSFRKTARDIFIPESIRKVDDDTYILRMGVRGHGLEAQGHQRVHENQTMLRYQKDTGLIRMSNYNVESPTKGVKWEIQPNDTDFYFLPSQSNDEIVETIANTMHWY